MTEAGCWVIALRKEYEAKMIELTNTIIDVIKRLENAEHEIYMLKKSAPDYDPYEV